MVPLIRIRPNMGLPLRYMFFNEKRIMKSDELRNLSFFEDGENKLNNFNHLWKVTKKCLQNDWIKTSKLNTFEWECGGVYQTLWGRNILHQLNLCPNIDLVLSCNMPNSNLR